jgi:PBP1b-binding outer membrane lipoprotein LpoB
MKRMLMLFVIISLALVLVSCSQPAPPAPSDDTTTPAPTEALSDADTQELDDIEAELGDLEGLDEEGLEQDLTALEEGLL